MNDLIIVLIEKEIMTRLAEGDANSHYKRVTSYKVTCGLQVTKQEEKLLVHAGKGKMLFMGLYDYQRLTGTPDVK